LLRDCRDAFGDNFFPRVIELYGTSDALEALVAAHVEDELSPTALCLRKSWSKILARIKQLPTQAALAELFYQDASGQHCVVFTCGNKARVEVLESMILLGKLDAKKRNILAIGEEGEWEGEEEGRTAKRGPTLMMHTRGEREAQLARSSHKTIGPGRK